MPVKAKVFGSASRLPRNWRCHERLSFVGYPLDIQTVSEL
jgi:hypothetical protein